MYSRRPFAPQNRSSTPFFPPFAHFCGAPAPAALLLVQANRKPYAIHMKTLIIGGTGTVGSQVVRQLLRQGQPVRVLITAPEKAALLPEGAEPVVGDLDLPATLPPAFEGIGSVFLVNRHSFTEVAQGAYAIAAAKRAGVCKIVYQSCYHAQATGAGTSFLATKISIERMLARTGLAYTLVSPTHLYQNDLPLRDEIA